MLLVKLKILQFLQYLLKELLLMD